jgi:PAS domain-containing protein
LSLYAIARTGHVKWTELAFILETLIYLSRQLPAALDLPQVLTAVCYATQALLHVPNVTIWIADEDTRTLTIQACSDAELGQSISRTPLGYGHGSLGWVAQHRQVLHIPDGFAVPHMLGLNWWWVHGFHSCLAIPILHQEHLLGVLAMMAQEPFCLSLDDHWLLEQLLAQAAVAIRNAMLEQTMQPLEAGERFMTEQPSEAFTRGILSSLQARIAVLDKEGTILVVNEAWQRFRNARGLTTVLGVGTNYLEVYRRAVATSDVFAQQALDGIQAVLHGTYESFELEYPHTTPGGSRWFMMTVIPLQSRDGAVVAHVEVTRQNQAEEALRIHHAVLQSLAGKLIWTRKTHGVAWRMSWTTI